MSRTRLYTAAAELRRAGLITTEPGWRDGKYRRYRVIEFLLVEAIPPLPPEYPSRKRDGSHPSSKKITPAGGTRSSHIRHEIVPRAGQSDGQNHHHKRLSALQPSIDSTQLGSSGRGVQEVEKVVRQCLPAAPLEALSLVNQWAAVVARTPSGKDQRVREAVGTISQRFNLPAAVVREAVEQAAAVLHPVVQRAIEIFDGQVIEVVRIKS